MLIETIKVIENMLIRLMLDHKCNKNNNNRDLLQEMSSISSGQIRRISHCKYVSKARLEITMGIRRIVNLNSNHLSNSNHNNSKD